MSGMIQLEFPRSGVVLVTLNRPDRRNALSIAMMTELVDALNRLGDQESLRVVILRAAGPVFCAGLDLAEAEDRELVVESAHCVAQTLRTIRCSRLISIAAVQGGAFAGGGGLVAACDMAVGTSDCRIGFPEARRGLLPALISEVLHGKVRQGDLAELFLVGDAIDALRAKEIGLFQRVVTPEKLIDEALSMADSILSGGPQTIVDTKRLLHTLYHEGSAVDVQSSSEATDEHLRARFSEEAAEGLRAFLEKRAPNWLSSDSSRS